MKENVRVLCQADSVRVRSPDVRAYRTRYSVALSTDGQDKEKVSVDTLTVGAAGVAGACIPVVAVELPDQLESPVALRACTCTSNAVLYCVTENEKVRVVWCAVVVQAVVPVLR